MQPSPTAETSILPAPRLRFCIVITPLLQNLGNRTGMAFCSFRTPRYPFQRYGMPVWLRFPNTADSLPNPVACSDFVHGLPWRVVPYEKRKSTSDKACPEDRLISDGGGDRISQQDRSACSIGRRAFHCNCQFDSLSPNEATACYRAAVEPSLTVFVQGKKRISLGGI